MKVQEFPVKIKWGLEVCYFPEFEGLIASILGSYNFDFATGSIHWIDGFGFDHKAEFWEGKNVEKLYKMYYELMLSLINSKLFTGLAHPDSIKCFNYLPVEVENLVDTYISLADALNQQNVYAEQSGGLALNYGFKEIGMNKTMLSIFKQKGIDIRLASDAHRPEDVGVNMNKMQLDLLQ